ncbi:hypothetical protein HRI_001903400 [Hibiscus trionum]|uniref:Single-stranded DNA binding protein Ssb-like OB fold domain-containing protein n=1 Tax=Hibiscus trionum TaxID=183268 RepID=A0A9W7LZS8_HIBTR|nr:hypothetical protein HRI_001903400 [Hibiscus trionum]
MATIRQQQNKTIEKRKPVFVKVDQLKPGTNGHTLIAKVLSSNVVVQKDRTTSRNLRQTRIAECLPCRRRDRHYPLHCSKW